MIKINVSFNQLKALYKLIAKYGNNDNLDILFRKLNKQFPNLKELL